MDEDRHYENLREYEERTPYQRGLPGYYNPHDIDEYVPFDEAWDYAIENFDELGHDDQRMIKELVVKTYFSRWIKLEEF